MLTKSEIIDRARELDFEDVGFTTAEPFGSQREVLESRREEYAWAPERGLDLWGGTDPGRIMPGARTIIVLMEAYFREKFPAVMEAHFGRCYLDDDRVTKDRLAARIKAFRTFLRDHGVDSKVPFNLPHRLAAARAGMGTFGKNCLFYSRRVALGGSWVLPVAVVVDREFAPDEPTLEVGCPEWCKNACLVACPTGALRGPRHIDPRRCISYLTYFGDGLTPPELREPMGLWVYGCDRCQNVCPRNQPWLAKPLPLNRKAAALVEDFELSRLLHMDGDYYLSRVWPHMFYMPLQEMWRWQMNVARAMGNSRDPQYVDDLARALNENQDDRVAAMAAWALGRIGGARARSRLERLSPDRSDLVRAEAQAALMT